MRFSDIDIPYCGDIVQPFWGILDFSIAPDLLYYAYVPVLAASLLIGIFLLPKTRESLRSRPLVMMLMFFVLWVLVTLAQWVLMRNDHIMFAWQLTAPLEIGMFLYAAYFAYVFIRHEDLPRMGKLALLATGAAVVALTPTTQNIVAYDLATCEGVIGPLWYAMYAVEAMIITAVFAYGAYWSAKEKEKPLRTEAWIFTLSFCFFLAVFFLSNAFGDATGMYEVNLLGPIGMVAFFCVLGYLVVKYKTFHSKVIATEVLVWGLVGFVGSQFFYARSKTQFILDTVTFVAAAIIGAMQIRMVKLEIKRKEELAQLLQQRESLQHLVTHKVKGAFTRTKFIFAELRDGTFGPTSEKMRDIAGQGLEFSEDGISSIDDVLNAANLKSGKVSYEMKPVDFRKLVETAVAQKKGPAKRKGLSMRAEIEDREFMVTGDSFWLKEVAYNLVDNAVKYTPQGSVTVGLTKQDANLLFWVKDTGTGITDEDKEHLFTEGGRGKESVKINPDSTGYGLFTIKLVIEGHGGKVWVESKVGEGSTFFVSLSLAA